jgi:hypothetical protein
VQPVDRGQQLAQNRGAEAALKALSGEALLQPVD